MSNRRRVTIQENEDGTVSVFFVPEYEAVICDDWDQALECAVQGVDCAE